MGSLRGIRTVAEWRRKIKTYSPSFNNLELAIPELHILTLIHYVQPLRTLSPM